MFRLKMIDLSHNEIKKFDYDSFSPLYQLQIIDLSYNKFETIPGSDLRQLVGLRVLNLSGNLFDKITDGDLVHSALQELFIMNCTYLRLIESNAFGNAPYLSIVDLSYATSLVFISPYAFENNTMMHRLMLTNTNLEYIPQEILSMVPQITVANSPLQCGCISKSIDQFHDHIIDLDAAYCSTLTGAMKKLNEISEMYEECRPEPILPFGETITAVLGDMFSLYCAARDSNDSLTWRLPNGTEILGRRVSTTVIKDLGTNIKKSSSILDFLHSFGHTLQQQSQFINLKSATRPRISVTKEQIRFEVATSEDAGVYRCSVRRKSHVAHRTIKLRIEKPAISLFPTEVGSHYVTLAWNASLPIKSSLVNLYLIVKDHQRSMSRSVQLSLQNPWLSYNLMRLKPNQNYTFCLIYVLQKRLSPGPMFETCTEITTSSALSILNTFSLTSIFIIFSLILILCAFALFRSLYFRFHIWQQQKYRSRMNQSISGQSFLSAASTTRDTSTAFDNQMDMSQIIPLKRITSSPESEKQQRIKGDEALLDAEKCSKSQPT